MADDSSEEEASQSTLTLALDSNKQKEFEDKVKKLKAQVSTFFVLKGGKKPGLVLIVLMPLFNRHLANFIWYLCCFSRLKT